MHGFAVRRKHIVTGFTIASRKIRLPLTERCIIGVLCGLTRCSFCSGCTENKDTVRTIYQFDIKMQGTDCFILVKGNGFLYNMIRILVGTLLSVSEGELSVSEIPEILAARNRIYAGRTVQPYGLYLHEIFYDDAAYRLPQGDAFFGSAVSGGERNGK